MSKDNIGILDPLGENNNPLTGEEYSDNYKELAKKWSTFPAYDNAKEIISDIKDNQVLLVISGTGSGKTVLIPKYALHATVYTGKIAITLPKQMITKSSAEFAAQTLDVELGKHVGYQYRGSDKGSTSKDTNLLYATDGTIVARVLTDPMLKDFDIVIIDEAHERKVNIDFLLYLLRNVLEKRPEFKVIIMSATVDESIFRKYYDEYRFKKLEITGRTNYPIESVFLNRELNIDKKEYIDEGLKIIKKIVTTTEVGDILFFVTSVRETQDICEVISSDNEIKNSLCIPVYSGMDKDQQELAQDKDSYKDEGDYNRKIIISTNVAESSLTIDGIKFVIDSGLELFGFYDISQRANILQKKLITHAQAKQRMGRAGRTEPGTCYHLYKKEDFDKNMERFPEPTIRKSNIYYEELRLLGIEQIGNVKNLLDTLTRFIEPPTEKYILGGLRQLRDLELIGSSCDIDLQSKESNITLTNMGKFIEGMQIDPMEGLALLMAYHLNCFNEVLSIITTINACKGSIPELFTLPLDILDDSDGMNGKKPDPGKVKWLTNKFDSSKEKFSNQYGDHIAIMKIFDSYLNKRDNPKNLNDWTYKYFLKRKTLEKSYDEYSKLKRRYRNILGKLEKIDMDIKEIMSTNITYRILASIMFGFRLNHLILIDKKIKTSDLSTVYTLDRYSFMNVESKNKVDLFYHELFKSGSSPIEAKIVSRVSPKAIDLMNRVSKLNMIKIKYD